ncbi:hypothetical protein F5876DRAFT_68991 [Lentinula aff. lateritia]|uniref:Uncharacterized protein n=1 Tax=Lentinula aff. lateritia TaxID=2804960 RepID=A0ACC1TPV2_9AGAR|nr:hypothetical protein F5876DRAFT_68991 [Lentinula aff. lateritia]
MVFAPVYIGIVLSTLLSSVQATPIESRALKSFQILSDETDKAYGCTKEQYLAVHDALVTATEHVNRATAYLSQDGMEKSEVLARLWNYRHGAGNPVTREVVDSLIKDRFGPVTLFTSSTLKIVSDFKEVEQGPDSLLLYCPQADNKPDKGINRCTGDIAVNTNFKDYNNVFPFNHIELCPGFFNKALTIAAARDKFFPGLEPKQWEDTTQLKDELLIEQDCKVLVHEAQHSLALFEKNILVKDPGQTIKECAQLGYKPQRQSPENIALIAFWSRVKWDATHSQLTIVDQSGTEQFTGIEGGDEERTNAKFLNGEGAEEDAVQQLSKCLGPGTKRTVS